MFSIGRCERNSNVFKHQQGVFNLWEYLPHSDHKGLVAKTKTAIRQGASIKVLEVLCYRKPKKPNGRPNFC